MRGRAGAGGGGTGGGGMGGGVVVDCARLLLALAVPPVAGLSMH